MQTLRFAMNIGLVILSADFRVIGMNSFARQVLGPAMPVYGKSVLSFHPRKSQPKVRGLLEELRSAPSDMPIAMIIDVLGKVLMMNLSRIDTSEESAGPLSAMTFIDITDQTGAEVNARSGIVELKKIPVYKKGCFMFLEESSIYFIRSDGNYSEVFTSGKSYYLHLNLKSILQRYAGPNFFRVHKSFIVNLSHARKLDRTAGRNPVIVFDREDIPPVPVARRRLSELKQALSLP